MSEEIIEWARKQIDNAEAELEKADALLQRLKRAGEDVSRLEADYLEAKRRLERFKAAFKD